MTTPRPLLEHLDLLVCPACRGALGASRPGLRCARCGTAFACDGEIPLLAWPNDWAGATDVTDTVRAFYEEHPFPSYDDLESVASLRDKTVRAIFPRLLDEQIPLGAMVLEVGCGTGQLSNFLASTAGRTVFATDICLGALRLGQRFKEANGLAQVAFLQMNLFKPAFQSESFDLVIGNGVLHHTSRPLLGLQTLVGLVRRGGWIVMGLYNRWGRIPTRLRRVLFRFAPNRLRFLDPYLRRALLNEPRRRAWFMDQYRHPHESTHTFHEVLGWFDRCGVEFVNGIPKPVPFAHLSAGERLFDPHPRGTRLDRALVQLAMLLHGGREGGFFVMIGRRKG